MSVCCSVDKTSDNPTKLVTYLDLYGAVKFGGLVKLLVDTGATHTLIGLSDVFTKKYTTEQQNKITNYLRDKLKFIEGSGIAVGTSSIKYYMVKFPEVKIDSRVYKNLVIGVLPTFSKLPHGLLGSSFIYAHDIHFNKDAGELSLLNCDSGLYQKYLITPSDKIYDLRYIESLVDIALSNKQSAANALLK